MAYYFYFYIINTNYVKQLGMELIEIGEAQRGFKSCTGCTNKVFAVRGKSVEYM